ncbi:hypothetical protein D3C71_2105120 [compost metagenome]
MFPGMCQQGTFLLKNGTFPNMFAVFVWCQSGFAFEDAPKVGGIVHVDMIGNFFAAEVGENQ